MALLFLDGMQHLSAQQIITKYDMVSNYTSGDISAASVTNQFGSVVQAYQISAGIRTPVLGPNFSALGAQSWVGLGIRYKSDAGSDNSNKITLLDVRDTTSASVARLAQQTSGRFVLDIGSNMTSVTSVTAFASGSTAWHLIEMAVSYGASATVLVYLSGAVVISYTGSVLTSANTGITRAYWGPGRLVAAHTNTVTDFYVLNNGSASVSQLLGSAMRIRTHWPSSDTSTSAWTPNTGTDHSALLRENRSVTSGTGHDGSATTLSAASNLIRDRLEIDDATGTYSAAEVIHAGQIVVVAQGSGGGLPINLLAELSGVVVSGGTTSAVSTVWSCHRSIVHAAPSGLAWSVSRLDAMTVGFETA